MRRGGNGTAEPVTARAGQDGLETVLDGGALAELYQPNRVQLALGVAACTILEHYT